MRLTDTARAFFGAMAANRATTPGPVAEAIRRLLADGNDGEAAALLGHDKTFNATLRTTCVATLLSAGHAENALPQHATADINCRIFRGETVAAKLAKLKELADPPHRYPARARSRDRRAGQGRRRAAFPRRADAAADVDGNGMHGLDERIGVTSLYEGRDYLFDLVKAYAG